MAITAAMVKELRDDDGRGHDGCQKSAWSETNGDMEAAVDWLRTKGLAKAAKKSDRTAAEGLVAVKVEGNKGVAVEVNSETDFRRQRTLNFRRWLQAIADAAIGADGCRSAENNADIGGKTVSEVDHHRQNRHHRREHERCAVWRSCRGAHKWCLTCTNAVADGMGKIGVLVALSTAKTKNSASRSRCTSQL